MTYQVVFTDELYHGIKGQKWGIRRYQNEDGSLKSKGKKHLSEKQKKNINKSLAKAAVGIGAAYLAKKLLKKNLVNVVLNSDLDTSNEESMVNLGKASIKFFMANTAITGLAVGNLIKQGKNISDTYYEKDKSNK